MTAPTHLICDCDGVLIDSEAVAFEVLQTELADLLPGRDLTAVIQPRLGLTLDDLLGDIAAEHRLTLLPARVEAIHQAVESAKVRLLRPVPGVVEALAAIALPKAVASNSDGHRVLRALQRTGLWPLFDGRVYTADQVGAAKPKPDVYLAACAGFPAAPAACLVVEDSVTGVTAAVAAGMRVIGFVGGGHAGPDQAHKLRAAGAEQTFDNMTALPELLRQLSARPRPARAFTE
jgi:HAD superfamily hydrolase (TIGR01509 family)